MVVLKKLDFTLLSDSGDNESDGASEDIIRSEDKGDNPTDEVEYNHTDNIDGEESVNR